MRRADSRNMAMNNHFTNKSWDKNSEQTKSDFVTILAHELRTPMTITKGYLSMILEGNAGSIPLRVREFLQEVYEGNEKLIKLVYDMERVVQIDNHAVQYDIKKIKPFNFILEEINKLNQKAREKNIILRVNLPKTADFQILADLEIFREIFRRVLENAIKFTDKGQVVVSAEEQIIDGEKFSIIKIADTGIGISKNALEHIFEKMYHANLTLTDQRGGVGLGLYIVKKLSEGMKAKVWAESLENDGSVFFIALPSVK